MFFETTKKFVAGAITAGSHATQMSLSPISNIYLVTGTGSDTLEFDNLN